MFSSQEWWNGGADAPGPEPIGIGKSLRFRGTQSLTRDFTINGSTNWTWSGWLKKTKNVAADQIIFHTDSPVQFSLSRDDSFGVTQTSVASFEDGKRRDPSGWYHRVDTYDGTDMRMYINGVLQQTWTVGSVGWNTAVTHDIGYDSSRPNEGWHGYMADIYFIDGQALSPEVFGTLDDNDVWVPAETNFGIGQSRYSDYVTGSSGWYASTTLPSTIFDGDDSTYCQTDDAGPSSTITFTPATPIPYTSSVEVLFAASLSVSLNGGANQTSPNPAAWFEIATGSGEITSIKFTGAYGGTVRGIKVDGVLLTDAYLWSANLFTNDVDTAVPDFNSTKKNFYSASPAYQGFDGNNNVYAGTTNPGSWMFFRPPGGIEVKESIFIDQNPTGWELESVYINENLVASNVSNPTINFTGTLTNLAIRGKASSLAATFARLVIDGKPLIDGVNGSYGANGFHLDFSDPSDIGGDSSGNGNDWTPSGFDFTTPGKFSARQAASAPGSYVADPAARTLMLTSPDQTFDGNLFTQCQVGNTASSSDYGGWYYFTPGFYNVSSFWFGVNSSAVATEVRINGESVTFTTGNAGPSNVFGDQWVIVDVPADGIVTEFAFTSAGASTNTQINGILLNGNQQANLLLDNLGTDYDLMQDSPTQNWATMQPLLPGTVPYYSGNYTKGNLVAGGYTTAFATSGNTIHIPTTGKWYAEAELVNNSYNNNYIGIGSEDTDVGNNTNGFFWGQNNSGDFYDGDTGNSLGRYEAVAEGDIVGIAYDADTNEIAMYKNGVLNHSGTAGSKIDAYKDKLIFLTRPYYNSGQLLGLNFGQKPFVYTPPAGYLSLQTQNLPKDPISNGRDHFQIITGPGEGGFGLYSESTDIDAQLGIEDMTFIGYIPGTNSSAQQFICDCLELIDFTTFTIDVGWGWQAGNAQVYVSVDGSNGTWTMINNDQSMGNGQTVTISHSSPFRYFKLNYKLVGQVNFGGITTDNAPILGRAKQAFPYGLWWIKDRSNDAQHDLVDSVRGSDTRLTCPAMSEAAWSAPTGSSVAWCWKVDGNAVTNNDGDITAQVASDTKAGFSIISYTGNDLKAQTIGHGLNKAPEWIIVKNRDQAVPYVVYHEATNPSSTLDSGQPLYPTFRLNDTSAAVVDTEDSIWDTTATTFRVRPTTSTNGNWCNNNGDNFIAYCWHSVPGYSSFGRFSGNGDNNGAFIHTGFRPAWVMIRPISDANDWLIMDSTRSPSNPVQTTLKANTTQVENGNDLRIDMLSNGFKNITNAGGSNGSQDYIYCAFAENPFSYPVTAR